MVLVIARPEPVIHIVSVFEAMLEIQHIDVNQPFSHCISIKGGRSRMACCTFETNTKAWTELVVEYFRNPLEYYIGRGYKQNECREYVHNLAKHWIRSRIIWLGFVAQHTGRKCRVGFR